MKKITSTFFLAIILWSCSKEAKIKVTNRVSNCKIESISFGDHQVPGSIITNASTSVKTIKGKKTDFPKTNVLKFYMVSAGNRVLLQTNEEYQLNEGAQLDITIENSTAVTTP